MNASPESALVTGAASGIGLAIATRFARAGMRLALVDIDAAGVERAAADLRAAGADAIAAVADVADEFTARVAVEGAQRRFGGLDVLVNNAGLPSSWSQGEESQRWRLGIDQTLTSVYQMCTWVAPGMQARRRGSIVNIASKAAYLPMPGAEWYGAAKAGVVSLTRSLALRWGRDGIRVNAICPDVIETPRTRAMLEAPERRRALVARTALGRLGRPEDIAEAALFLASDATAGFITGTALMVDGGAQG